jgi:hypothetical protein
MDKELVEFISKNMEVGEVKNWDDPETILKLGIKAKLIVSYSLSQGVAEVLWTPDILRRYLEVEVPIIVMKAIAQRIPATPESAKLKQSSKKSATVHGAEVKSPPKE